jgi:hypothetical protein
VLWLGFALLVGQLVERRLEVIGQLRGDLGTARDQHAAIANYCVQLSGQLTDVESRLAMTDHRQLDVALERLAELDHADNAAVPRALADTLEAFLGRCEYSVYKRDDGRFERLPELSSAASLAAEPAVAARQAALLSRTVKAPAIVTLADAQSEQCLDGAAIAAPICVGPAQELVGLLCIEVVAPSRIVPATRHAVQLVCAALGPKIARHGQRHILRTAA